MAKGYVVGWREKVAVWGVRGGGWVWRGGGGCVQPKHEDKAIMVPLQAAM